MLPQLAHCSAIAHKLSKRNPRPDGMAERGKQLRNLAKPISSGLFGPARDDKEQPAPCLPALAPNPLEVTGRRKLMQSRSAHALIPAQSTSASKPSSGYAQLPHSRIDEFARMSDFKGMRKMSFSRHVAFQDVCSTPRPAPVIPESNMASTFETVHSLSDLQQEPYQPLSPSLMVSTSSWTPDLSPVNWAVVAEDLDCLSPELGRSGLYETALSESTLSFRSFDSRDCGASIDFEKVRSSRREAARTLSAPTPRSIRVLKPKPRSAGDHRSNTYESSLHSDLVLPLYALHLNEEGAIVPEHTRAFAP